MIKPRNSAVTLDWPPVAEHTCLQFFSPASIRRYFESYWAIRHPNVNFVHQPSYDPVQAKPSVSVRHGLALGPLNLFALASAIHSLIFQFRNSWGDLQLLPPIHSALNNWKEIWQQFTAALVSGMSPHLTVDHNNLQPEAMWKRVGFCSYCPYWLLANLVTDKVTARKATDSAVEEERNDLEGLDYGPLDSTLNQCDQTSMLQVNDLILSLSDFRIAG
ncbi:hypothetical protein BJX61DRAFT_124384 [Aspergillus egyptiacus]|nr:hypothetical protein BJX61DRAFT_124384 [Aspergillus egyptiacus]